MMRKKSKERNATKKKWNKIDYEELSYLDNWIDIAIGEYIIKNKRLVLSIKYVSIITIS